MPTFWTAKQLFLAAQQAGWHPRWETAAGLFSVEWAQQRRFVYYTKTAANSQLGSALCQDKQATRLWLEREGLANIAYCCSSFLPDVKKFIEAQDQVIVKPVYGMKAQGVRKWSSGDAYPIPLEDWIWERFIDGPMYRCLVVGNEVVGVQQRTRQPIADRPWHHLVTNLTDTQLVKPLMADSATIARQLQMGILAVDWILDGDTRYVLELNSMPGLRRWHEPDAGPILDMAAIVLSFLVQHAL